MSINSTVAVVHEDGTVSQVYGHWDGDLENVGAVLKQHYSTLERAEALVALGDFSSLDASIECPSGHSWANPVKGYTVFYGRDRHDHKTSARLFDSFDDFKLTSMSCEFNYVFVNNKWLVSFGYNNNFHSY